MFKYISNFSFLFSPELAHYFFLRILKFGVINQEFSDEALKINLWGKNFINPLGLADAMLSDPTLFTRSDEVEAAWKLYTPLIELMDNSPWKLPIYNYESMTWGPPESDQLLSKDNFFWRRP